MRVANFSRSGHGCCWRRILTTRTRASLHLVNSLNQATRNHGCAFVKTGE
uniref:Uncharacterized protein n=1 Tax=Arundo donax TaxID=35708 RepID=A0A0A9D9D9_ARUDO